MTTRAGMGQDVFELLEAMLSVKDRVLRDSGSCVVAVLFSCLEEVFQGLQEALGLDVILRQGLGAPLPQLSRSNHFLACLPQTLE
jgi:hypothetical protein